MKNGTSMAYCTDASHMRMMMPTSLTSSCRVKWDSGGTNLPVGELPLSSEEKGAVVLFLINEFNRNLAMELDDKPNLSPTNVPKRRGQQFLVVGASNAGRTAEALEVAEATVFRAVIPGWRCIKDKGSRHCGPIVRNKLQEVKGNCVVLLQLFDNNFFLARTEDGGLIPAVREAVSGKYHVHGDLVVAPKEIQYSLFSIVKPVIELASSHQKVIIRPLPQVSQEQML